jgi:signal transduction histidine kinase
VRSHTKDLGDEGEALDHDLERAAGTVEAAQRVLSEARGEQQKLRVVASVGTQFAAFIHEMNALLAQARSVEVLAARLAKEGSISRSARPTLGELRAAIGELVQQLERQVSFLTDVVGGEAQRRRRRLPVRERIDTAMQLLSSRIEHREQSIEIDVTPDLRTPPMFSSELLSILINVLSNAIKAAGDGGTILVQGKPTDTHLVLEVANTGEAVDLAEAERWFRPFESTTSEIDEVLGQGMGLGLPIVRRILDEYNGSADFIPSEPPFATTVQIRIPARSR